MKKLRIAIIAAALCLLPLVAGAECDSTTRTISVSGSSAVTVPAENATIHAQLKVVSDTVETSYKQVMENLVNLTKRMQQFGMEKNDITVSAITQKAEYEWAANTRKLSGYSASCSLQLKVHKILDSYKIHSDLSAFTELTILKTEYGLEDYSSLQAQSLQEALQKARKKAVIMAQSLDADVGKVLTIAEMGNQPMPMMRRDAVMLEAASAPNPIDITTHGTVTISSNVSATFELK